jgi:TonB family protein
MHDVVSQALYGRLREPEGLRKMVVISSGLHVALAALALIVPARWWSNRLEMPRNVMEISLGGAPGPVSGGLTPISGRAIQKAVDTMPKLAPTPPPAAAKPEMVVPTEKPRVTTKPTPDVKESVKDAKGRTPTTGLQTRDGRAQSETGSTSVSTGLSTGGGGTNGQINIGDFCCPDYISQMVATINRNWSSRQATVGITTMRFTIQRDGTLTDITVEKSSGYQALDFMAQRALIAVGKLAPLPAEYTNPSLTINLQFEYQR